jgi:hypothetical protein
MERLNNRTILLLTSNSRNHTTVSNNIICRSQLLESPAVSLILNRFNNRANLNREGRTDLTIIILKLIQSEKIKLQTFIQMQLYHEIDLKVDINQTKLRKYETTISKLRKKFDKLETMILYLTT